MANKAIMIEVDDEASVYRLVGPGDEEGAITDYGVPATLRIVRKCTWPTSGRRAGRCGSRPGCVPGHCCRDRRGRRGL